MAYQSKEIGFDHADGDKNVLLLADGNVSRGHQGPMTTALGQRGKTGHCPCCVEATYAAVPPIFKRAEYSEEEATGMSIWRKHGPCSVRLFAAAIYAHTSSILPAHWDWAARNLGMEPPPVPRISK